LKSSSAHREDGKNSNMAFETIQFELRDSVAVVTLNRPSALNALNVQMGEELLALLEGNSGRGVRAMILTGAGRAFCAGGDLREMQKIAEQTGRVEAFFDKPLKMLNRCILTLRGAPFPIVAAVNGPAFGAGCNFALACDLVIAAESARFSESFVNIGLTPDCGGTFLLPKLIGMKRAAQLLMTGEVIGARSALEMGLINAVVEDGTLMDEAFQLASRLATGPTGSIARIKEMLDMSATNDFPSQLEVEHRAQMESGQSADFKEGVAAFMEKRPPRFTGS
jgi:2-(1,2-epoxy-1,2-dihydrophenyl)acetyl-CoA isomerase